MDQEIEIVPNKLHFLVLKGQPKSNKKFHFTIDDNQEFIYLPFFSDFGPLSLAQIHKFWVLTNKHINAQKGKVVFYTDITAACIANGCLLCACYRLIELRCDPSTAMEPLTVFIPHLKPYRDASSFPSTYDLTVYHCVAGLYQAMHHKWYDPETFDTDDWCKYELVENGDMNWLIPNKLLAFASPYYTNVIRGGWKVCTPKDLLPIFHKKGVNHVVRLCQKFYDEKDFTSNNINHTELYFPDGSTPNSDVLRKWLSIIEKDGEVVALHCKAGLGRTGTLAACYMIKNYHMTGDEAIGWIRLCRPGSIIGPQQKYVIKYYERTINDKESSPVRASDCPQFYTPTKTLRRALGVAEQKRSTSRSAVADDSDVSRITKVPQPRKYNRPNPKTPLAPKY